MIKRLTAIVALCALGGCASAPAAPPANLADALAQLNQKAVVDLDAALAIANTPPVDPIAAQCYPVLKTYLTKVLGTSKPTVGQVQGVFSGFETARKLRMQAESSVGQPVIPVELRMGCAALVQDERDFAVRLAILLGGAAAGAGVPVIPAAVGGAAGALNALPK